MIRFFLPLLFFLSFSSAVWAQSQPAVTGRVQDPSLGLSLGNAVVSILNAKDSTLVHFTRSRKEGDFAIDKLPPGDYLAMISYPKYTDFVERFSLSQDSASFDLGAVNMLLISQLLQDVVITANNAIVIKGDTIEYDASKLVIQPNSKVEDLLTQLPGIQVDKDGKITAHGESVEKVLVDGEEFFGDDPTLVTRNIRGDMVDKIQLYDKKSDQATFTGIDDGQEAKTINIQLKEDSKQGMFGKVDAGKSTDEYYTGQIMFNTFKGSQKFAAYGTFGNTGTIGLNWQDNEKYASSNNMVISDGMIMIYGGGGDDLDSFDGRYNGQGIPQASTGGLHYDTKWNDKKETINANYKIGQLDVKGDKRTLTQNNLPTGLMESDARHDFDNHMFRQKADVRYTIDFDSTSSLRVTLDGSLKNSRSENAYSSFTDAEQGRRLNQSTRNTSTQGDTKAFSASALWNKKLKKKGRTLSINLDQKLNREDNQGYLNSENTFFTAQGEVDSLQLVDQRKTRNIETSELSSNIAYTEPLSKRMTLGLNYRINYNQGKSDLRSFNQGAGGEYTQIDSLYSNDFDLDQLSNQFGATLNFNGEKDKINLSFNGAGVNFKQIDRFHDQRITRSFINLNPSARWSHQFSKQQSFNLNYYGYTNQPSLNQIQPVRENQDPLNVVIGNPDLDPAFSHSLNASFYTYKVLSGRYISVNARTSVTTNGIVSNVNTDEQGKSTYRYENLKNETPLSYGGYFSYGNKLKFLKADYSFDFSASSNSYFNMINDAMNKTSSLNLDFDVSLRKQAEKKYSIYLSAGPTYTSSVASLQKEYSNEGWGFNAYGRGQLYLPGKFELFTDGNYRYTEATQAFDEDFRRFIWNGGINKKFLKTEELKISFTVNDILNQNVGFERVAFNNMNTQTQYTTIKRYFMFSLTWDFNRMGGGN